MSKPKFPKGIQIDKEGRIEVDCSVIYPLYLQEMKAARVFLAPGNDFDGKASAIALELARSIASFDCKMAAREASGDDEALLHFRIIDGSGQGAMRLNRHADGKDPQALALQLRPLVQPALKMIMSARKGRAIKEPADAWVRPDWWDGK